MAMRRNILRKTLSEDLDWANCLQRDPNLISFHIFDQKRNDFHLKKTRTRSQESSTERHRACLSELDEAFCSDIEESKHTTPEKVKKSKKAKK